MAKTTTQTKGKFPIKSGRGGETRFTPPAQPKGYSSIDQNKGEFPVKTSRDTGKRFNPPAP